MPSSAPPNILYIHSHDTGRYVQPYGYQVPTPNIQLLADQGVLFRQAFSVAPTCSGSRASLLTGQYCHNNGMLGLAHRGWTLNDYGKHWVHTLREAGYRSVLIGEQHISTDPHVIGFDRVVEVDSHRAEAVAPTTIATLHEQPEGPWFMSVGFFETHLGARHALLAASHGPSGHDRHPARYGRLQGQRPLAGPGDRRRPSRPSRPRASRRDADHLHHRSRRRLPEREGDA